MNLEIQETDKLFKSDIKEEGAGAWILAADVTESPPPGQRRGLEPRGSRCGWAGVRSQAENRGCGES